MNTIKTVEDFKKFVGNDGKLFSVTFRKLDGSERKMVANLNVRKYLKGGKLLYNPASRNNIIVFSMKDRAYRTINIDRLLRVKAFNTTIQVG